MKLTRKATGFSIGGAAGWLGFVVVGACGPKVDVVAEMDPDAGGGHGGTGSIIGGGGEGVEAGGGGTGGTRGGAVGGAAGTSAGLCGPHCANGACDAGYADCNGTTVDGCETDVFTSITDCGACGSECSIPMGTAYCSYGDCITSPTPGGAAGSGMGGNGAAGSGMGGRGGSGGLPPGAQCVDGDRKFDLCTVNFDPRGDCICLSGYWGCPLVACPPCPDPVENGCEGDVRYARVPDSVQCCQYANACAAPSAWSTYATPQECKQATP